MKFIKRYKGHIIYKFKDSYTVAIIKQNIAGSYIDYSNKFPSIEKCKDFINDLKVGKTR